jgi:tRNA(Ile)-lysidine synthase
MRPWRAFAGGWLWRPLLELPRVELREWAEARALRWIEDPTNAEPGADRNFLRLEVMPLLHRRWPRADVSLARSATLAAEAARLLSDQDRERLADARAGDALSVAVLVAMGGEARRRVLRAWVAERGLPPLPAEGLARIEADLLHARPDSGAAFAWSGAVVRAWHAALHAEHASMPLPGDWTADWDGAAPLELPGGGHLVLEAADAAPRAMGFDRPVRAHARGGGERIRLPGRRHTHSLKHALQDAGIPPWRRDRLPVLSDPDGEVLAAGDAIVSARLADWLDRHGLRLRMQDPAD